jgi:hypothetical protein
MRDNWHTEDLEEAEYLHSKAQAQIEKWGSHPESSFARQQVAMWNERLMLVRWCEPGRG